MEAVGGGEEKPKDNWIKNGAYEVENKDDRLLNPKKSRYSLDQAQWCIGGH